MTAEACAAIGSLASANVGCQAALHGLGATAALAALLLQHAGVQPDRTTCCSSAATAVLIPRHTAQEQGHSGTTHSTAAATAESPVLQSTAAIAGDGEAQDDPSSAAEAMADMIAERAVWAVVELTAGNADVQDAVSVLSTVRDA